MLILTRRPGETLVFGDDQIRITLLGINGNQARIGVHAPSNVSVHREEIYEKIKKEGNENLHLDITSQYDYNSAEDANDNEEFNR